MLLNCLLYYFLCSLELRELEAKLRAGYMNKERAAQLTEKYAKEAILKVCEEKCLIKITHSYLLVLCG